MKGHDLNIKRVWHEYKKTMLMHGFTLSCAADTKEMCESVTCDVASFSLLANVITDSLYVFTL